MENNQDNQPNNEGKPQTGDDLWSKGKGPENKPFVPNEGSGQWNASTTNSNDNASAGNNTASPQAPQANPWNQQQQQPQQNPWQQPQQPNAPNQQTGNSNPWVQQPSQASASWNNQPNQQGNTWGQQNNQTGNNAYQGQQQQAAQSNQQQVVFPPQQAQQTIFNDVGMYNTGTQSVPNATSALVLGILSIVTCAFGIVLGIIAIVLGNNAIKAYEANPSVYSKSSFSNAKAGKICGIIGLALGALALLGNLGRFSYHYW
jgi:hypothetical protein